MHFLKDITKLVVIGSFGKILINGEIKLSRIKPNSGPTTKPRAKAPAWFIEFERRNNQRLDRIENRLDRVIKVNNLKE